MWAPEQQGYSYGFFGSLCNSAATKPVTGSCVTMHMSAGVGLTVTTGFCQILPDSVSHSITRYTAHPVTFDNRQGHDAVRGAPTLLPQSTHMVCNGIAGVSIVVARTPLHVTLSHRRRATGPGKRVYML